jgi:predicted transcriptional regulator of viral defense system
MWIHGIGGDERHIFVNSEQSEKPPNRNKLTQDSIDRAFRNEQRVSKLIYTHQGVTFVVLNSKNSDRLDVIQAKTPSGENVEVTSLERTLIDITVRPAYAGGTSRVFKSFQIARGKASIEKMLGILKQLDYTYPYHQSLGFYMKRSGYTNADLDLVRRIGTRFNFYLGHRMKDPEFDDEFKVYFPKSLE